MLEGRELQQLRDKGIQWESINRGLLTREFVGVSLTSHPTLRIDSVSLSILEPTSISLEGVDIDVAPLIESSVREGPAGPGLNSSVGSIGLPGGFSMTITDGRLHWGDRLIVDGFSGVATGDNTDLIWPEGSLSLAGDNIDLSAGHKVEIERWGLSVEAEAHLSISGALGAVDTANVILREPVVRGDILSPYPVSLSDIEVEIDRGGGVRVVTQEGGDILTNLTADRPSLTVEGVHVSELLSIISSVIPELDDAEISGVISGGFILPEFSIDIEVEGLVINGAIDRVSSLRRGVFTYRIPTDDGDLGVRRSGEGTEGWAYLRDISPYLPWAVVAAEDSTFWTHDGYDPDSIREALAANIDAGEIVRGGSTLTQQLAKNLFLTGDQTLIRKVRELVIAVELDNVLGKERIMELYLNVVEWGPNIYGISEAAEAYFMKRPSQLTGKEAAFLASILPSPRRFYRDWYLQNRAGEYRVSWVLENMANSGFISHREARQLESGRLLFVPPPAQ